MFTISVQTHFWASHQLSLPDGTKEPAHSHNWIVSANVCSDTLNNMGIVMDFGQLKSALDKIVDEFDNTSLDRIDYFRKNNSSAEYVAKYIYEKLEPTLPKRLKLQSIKVVEEPGCSASYSTTDCMY
jgi:6-pyruvoyltetrahydropterin/6-carboxytetrahydropterin synthase